MSCADDPVPLSDEIVAERAARLAAIAEATEYQHFNTHTAVYVIGTEVLSLVARPKSWMKSKSPHQKPRVKRLNATKSI